MLWILTSTAFAHGLPDGDPGEYDSFPAARAEIVARVPIESIPAAPRRGNDVWGWVSESGREYALMGTDTTTVVVDLDVPEGARVVAEIPHARSTWSDMKVYGSFAYVSNENSGSVQVLDLAGLDSGLGVVEHAPVVGGGLDSAHNVVLNPDSGFLYPVGHNVGSHGMLIYDLAEPSVPRLVGSWGPNYVHDAHVLTMHEGPWAGREIGFLASGRNGLQIVDLTDKLSPWLLSELPYDGVSYAHQCWYDADTQLLYFGDESDERQGVVDSTTTYVFDVSDLEAPTLAGTFTNGSTAIDHNLHVVDGIIYEANYTSGLRIFDARWDAVAPLEVGFVDTWPASDRTSFDGAWGVFADFPSGRVLVNDGDFGLFVVDPTAAITEPPDAIALHLPRPEAVVSPTVARLTWHKSWGAADYLVEVGRDPAMADRVWFTETDALSVELRDASLPGCESFWWKVTARGPHGDTPGPVRPLSTGPLGELSGDAVIDDIDLTNLRVAWRGQFPHGDLDRDGDVDEADRDILLDAWGRCP